MKEVLGKNLFIGDILAVATAKGIEIAIVETLTDKEVGVTYVKSNKSGLLKKSSNLLVIHENNFNGDLLSKIQTLRTKVMSPAI
ncbi:MAG: hypothetical protein WC648_04110 [Candidatus Paceibacterota bacterium]|jgi:hypothetical protein